MDQNEPERHRTPPPRTPWALLAVNLQMAASIGLGVAAGWWLDRRTDWAPWGMLAGGLLGTAVGIYCIVKEAS